MISNFLFLIKIIRTFKEFDILRLIGKKIKYKFAFNFVTFFISIGKSKSNKYKDSSDGVRIAQALNQLGPSFIKLGQLISTRPDIIGDVIAKDMALLRDSLPPFSKPRPQTWESPMAHSLCLASRPPVPCSRSPATPRTPHLAS